MGFDCTDPEEVINFFCDIWLSTVRGRKEGGGGVLLCIENQTIGLTFLE